MSEKQIVAENGHVRLYGNVKVSISSIPKEVASNLQKIVPAPTHTSAKTVKK